MISLILKPDNQLYLLENVPEEPTTCWGKPDCCSGGRCKSLIYDDLLAKAKENAVLVYNQGGVRDWLGEIIDPYNKPLFKLDAIYHLPSDQYRVDRGEIESLPPIPIVTITPILQDKPEASDRKPPEEILKPYIMKFEGTTLVNDLEWKEALEEKDGALQLTLQAMREFSSQELNAFKEKLIREIENEIEFLSNARLDLDRGARAAFKNVLQRINKL